MLIARWPFRAVNILQRLTCRDVCHVIVRQLVIGPRTHIHWPKGLLHASLPCTTVYNVTETHFYTLATQFHLFMAQNWTGEGKPIIRRLNTHAFKNLVDPRFHVEYIPGLYLYDLTMCSFFVHLRPPLFQNLLHRRMHLLVRDRCSGAQNPPHSKAGCVMSTARVGAGVVRTESDGEIGIIQQCILPI